MGENLKLFCKALPEIYSIHHHNFVSHSPLFLEVIAAIEKKNLCQKSPEKVSLFLWGWLLYFHVFFKVNGGDCSIFMGVIAVIAKKWGLEFETFFLKIQKLTFFGTFWWFFNWYDQVTTISFWICWPFADTLSQNNRFSTLKVVTFWRDTLYMVKKWPE